MDSLKKVLNNKSTIIDDRVIHGIVSVHSTSSGEYA